MDYRLSSELVEWQQRVHGFVERELQPHDEEIERTGVVSPYRRREHRDDGAPRRQPIAVRVHAAGGSAVVNVPATPRVHRRRFYPTRIAAATCWKARRCPRRRAKLTQVKP
jgi:choline dehydrogenase-like flavoprotein